MCVTSRLIDVVSVFQIKLSKENLCVSHLPFRKMLSKKKHITDNFLLKFQNEDKRFINIYHFGIEPTGFQTALTHWNYFLKQLSIQTAVKANTPV